MSEKTCWVVIYNLKSDHEQVHSVFVGDAARQRAEEAEKRLNEANTDPSISYYAEEHLLFLVD